MLALSSLLILHVVFMTAEARESPRVLGLPRIAAVPSLEDFISMQPNGDLGKQLLRVEGFVQRDPRDGEPASQRTEAYLGYDAENLYVVFLCFDSEPEKIRARMTRREDAFEDDFVELTLDTFNDRRRGYVFWANPFGIQADALWTEGIGSDFSFDTLWHSEGRLTEQGYVVRMVIPFKSLRFTSAEQQSWGIVLLRHIPRSSEWAYWPHVSSRIQGRLNQAATLNGIESISPGRNIQLIPYGAFRSFRALDQRDANNPRFVHKRAEFDGGLDAKFVLKDSFVLDVALNPDFSQVESDEPQVTANERFEVFFPEKRPFFLENANYFRTPINLVFTRRIADPQFGIRLTGKAGPYAIGAMFVDDQSPGRREPPGSPLEGTRAYFGILRVSRDVFDQSNIGFIYTDREYEGGHNRVGGVDGRFRLDDQWVANVQAVTSATEFVDGTRLAGPAYAASLSRNGRQFIYNVNYFDVSPGFDTLAGFNPRPDVRQVHQFTTYRFRPEGERVIWWGPSLFARAVWDHSGTRLDYEAVPSLDIEFAKQTFLSFFHSDEHERLRPSDFPVLEENRDFARKTRGLFFRSSFIRQLSLNARYFWGEKINFVPADGQPPDLVERDEASLNVSLRPNRRLRIDNTYILLRLTDRGTGASVLNNHIIRARASWQFNREVSIRTILQYDTLLTNSEFTSLDTRKNFNADFLFTWQVNPWTVLFAGYNSNLQNIDLIETSAGTGIVRPRDRFINDGRQLFVKFSYLFRY